MSHELLIYVVFGLCIFALFNPLIVFNRTTYTFYLAIFSSIFQLVLYHQFFRWDIFGVVWRNGLFLILLVVVIVGIYLRKADQKLGKTATIVICSAIVAVSVCTTWILPKIISHQYPDRHSLDIVSPFPVGNFFIAHGGPFGVYNRHSRVPAQRYAYDITKIEKLIGIRGTKIVDNSLDDYFSMNVSLYSPCTGNVNYVSRAGAGVSEIEKRVERLAGKSIVVNCNGDSLVMAHLNTLEVAKGDFVTTGERVGTLGNTGNSSDPHLHIHAIAGLSDSIECIYFDCDGIPLKINGRLYLRNDVLLSEAK